MHARICVQHARREGLQLGAGALWRWFWSSISFLAIQSVSCIAWQLQQHPEWIATSQQRVWRQVWRGRVSSTCSMGQDTTCLAPRVVWGHEPLRKLLEVVLEGFSKSVIIVIVMIIRFSVEFLAPIQHWTCSNWETIWRMPCITKWNN